MPRKRIVPLVLALTAVAAPSAHAQGDGVTIDPGSPTSKEYAIPLEGARRDAAGGEEHLGHPQQGDRSAPLFGEGVKPDTGSAATPQTTSRPKAKPAASGKPAAGNAKRGEATARADPPADRARTERTIATLRADASADGGFSDGATIFALAFAVLVLGGVLGSILRRRAT